MLATEHLGDRPFVVSGCSGSGKSTLIAALAALAARGESVLEEPGRAIVPTFREHRCQLVFLPRAPVAERVAFVLARVSSQTTVAAQSST